jgi:histidine triad (HIT) family protein
MSDCVFCDILSGELPGSLVYQDDRCTALMDIQPVNPGHVLVIPNRHAAYLGELDDDLASHMLGIARRSQRSFAAVMFGAKA